MLITARDEDPLHKRARMTRHVDHQGDENEWGTSPRTHAPGARFSRLNRGLSRPLPGPTCVAR